MKGLAKIVAVCAGLAISGSNAAADHQPYDLSKRQYNQKEELSCEVTLQVMRRDIIDYEKRGITKEKYRYGNDIDEEINLQKVIKCVSEHIASETFGKDKKWKYGAKGNDSEGKYYLLEKVK